MEHERALTYTIFTMKNNIQRLFFPLLLFYFLFACSAGENQDNQIRVGITSGPERAIAEAAKKVAKDKYDLDVELILFNDYIVPNEALLNGDIDANAFQHEPYLREQSQHRGYHFAIVGKTFLYPIAAYSKKIKHIDELKDGQTIAIPNDATNAGRALLLLQQQGLITLRSAAGLLPTLRDVEGNPQHVEIIQLEAPQLPRVLDDNSVTLAVINSNFAQQAGLIAEKNGLIVEQKTSPYVNVIVTRADDSTNVNIKHFVQAYQSEEVERAAKTIFGGSAIKGW